MYSFRTFWIDALCMNQADVEERSSQVSIMDQVYTNSERCLIWLGDANETTQPILQALTSISNEYYPQLREATDGFSEEAPNDFKYTTDYFEILFNDCTARDIATFFERAWFSRVWVQQEAILAPKAVCRCGRLEILWRDVYRASRWLVVEWPNIEEESGLDKVFSALDMAWIFAESSLLKLRGVALSTVLNGTRYLEATDVRDKFYGVLGLAEQPKVTQEFMDWFHVDYGKSISSVFTDASLSSFTRQGMLTALEFVDQVRFETRVSDCLFPSWVLRLDRNFEDDTRFNFGADCFCCPLPLDLSLLSSCADHPYVKLKGYEVDRVSRVLVEDSTNSNALALLGRMLDAGAKALAGYERSNTASYLLDCLTTGRQTKFLASLNSEECSQILAMLNKICAAGANEEEGIEVDSETDEKLIDSLSVVYNIARKVCMNRCLFLTSNGNVGLGHPSLQGDDCFTALAGSKYLCILRPYFPPSSGGDDNQGGDRSAYQFVGLAYIPGRMNGEIVDAKHEADEEPEIFKIW
jgi:hypothetical protein